MQTEKGCSARIARELGEDSPAVQGKCHEVTKGDGPRWGFPQPPFLARRRNEVFCSPQVGVYVCKKSAPECLRKPGADFFKRFFP